MIVGEWNHLSMMKRLLSTALSLIAALTLADSDAPSRLARLRSEARRARQSKDGKALLAVELDAAEFFHYSAPATEQLALTYGEMGEQEQALRALHDFVAMGQADDDLAAAPAF